LATKLLGVTTRRISLCVTHGDNHSPIPSAEDASTVQPVNEVAIQNGEKKSDDTQVRVLGVGPRVAAIPVPSIALVGGLRGWGGIIVPSHRNGGGDDAAGRSESHDEREERLVEQHCGD